MKDYINFFEKYRMFLYVYLSPAFVAENRRVTYDLLEPIDHDFIRQHREYRLDLMRRHV
jgi:hypothetical protein